MADGTFTRRPLTTKSAKDTQPDNHKKEKRTDSSVWGLREKAATKQACTVATCLFKS